MIKVKRSHLGKVGGPCLWVESGKRGKHFRQGYNMGGWGSPEMGLGSVLVEYFLCKGVDFLKCLDGEDGVRSRNWDSGFNMENSRVGPVWDRKCVGSQVRQVLPLTSWRY